MDESREEVHAPIKRTTLVNHKPGNHVEKLAPYMGARFDKNSLRKGGGTRTINRRLRARNDNRQNSTSGLSNGSSAGSTSLDDLEGDSGNRAPSLSQLSFKSQRELGSSVASERIMSSMSFKDKLLENLSHKHTFEEETEGHVPLYHETGYPLATRGLLEREIQTNSTAINLSGGIQIRYQSILAVRIPHLKAKSSGIAFNQSLKRIKFSKKIVVLRHGRFRVFAVPRNGSGVETGTNMLTENDLDECKLDEDFLVSNLRGIRYNQRGNKVFTLVYWKRRKVPTSDGVYHVERTMQFKTSSGTEAEDWIRLFLLEARNQAMVFDDYAKVLRKERKNNVAVIAFLRLSVDLWSLSQGKGHPRTKDAQLRLADWLIAHSEVEEARFWEEYAVREEYKRRRGSPLDELKADISDDDLVEKLKKKMTECTI